MAAQVNSVIRVITEPTEVQRYVDDVQKGADSERNALGFFPKSIYAEHASRGKLFVAVAKMGGVESYIGHLLFALRFPRATVLQLFVQVDARKAKTAERLINELVASLVESCFLSIYARVAEDLAANKFWERQEFYVQRIESGGATRNRTILVRCKELSSPQLFATTGLTQFNRLGLPTVRNTEPPLFLLDLNVLFDIGPRRPKHAEMRMLVQAERSNLCRLAISSEILTELQRHAPIGRTDPMEAYVSTFPTFPIVKSDETRALISELQALVFPTKGLNSLSENDRSDLAHLATAIQRKLAGLVTNDKAILAAGQALQNRYGIYAVSSAAYQIGEVGPAIPEANQTSANTLLDSRLIAADDLELVHEFLGALGISGPTIAESWLPSATALSGLHQIGVWRNTTLLGYLSWPKWSPEQVIYVHAAVSETDPEAQSVARALLRHLISRTNVASPRRFFLKFPKNQSLLRETAFGLGFSAEENNEMLVKVADGRVWTAANWDTFRHDLLTRESLGLPVEVPLFRSHDQQMEVLTPRGEKAYLPLTALEDLLSPILFCLSNRPAVITPIRRHFAEHLLGTESQGSLLPNMTASLFAERHYISGPRTLKLFERGTVIFFYESSKSNGRSAIVAIGRVRSAYHQTVEVLGEHDFEKSVLTHKSTVELGNSQQKTVTVFDSIFKLPNLVGLTTLRRLGCGDSNHLLTTNRITSQQMQEILTEAFAK